MKVVIVDVYGDGDVLRVFEDKPGLDEALAAFRSADERYCEANSNPKVPAEEASKLYHGGLSEFMASRGHPPVEHREVAL